MKNNNPSDQAAKLTKGTDPAFSNIAVARGSSLKHPSAVTGDAANTRH